MNNSLIFAKDVCKSYGSKKALNQINLEIGAGKVLGLVGPNGAGKTTLLQSFLGLITCEGQIQVLDLDPFKQRVEMLKHVSYIADVAVMPQWLKVNQAIEYMAGIHPNFSPEKAKSLLSKTNIPEKATVKTLSKGMATQLYLDLILSIDAKLLILDEPTLGLDLMARRQFYSHLLENFYSENRSIIITSHQIEEIEHILNHVVFLHEGEVILDQSLIQMRSQFSKVEIESESDYLVAAKALNPIYHQELLGKHTFIYNESNSSELEKLGVLSEPSLADVFVAMMKQGN